MVRRRIPVAVRSVTAAAAAATGPVVTTGSTSVADCLRRAPELLMSWRRAEGGGGGGRAWLDMVSDIPLVEVGPGGGGDGGDGGHLTRPAILAETYDFHLEAALLLKCEQNSPNIC